jgi:dTDP-4-dehydrorhamnose 3,5-epimerase
VTAPYSPEHDRGLRFDDPDIAIDWPVNAGDIQLSAKDADAPSFADTETGFTY